MIKGLLLKEATKGAQIVNTNGLDDYYRILKCSYIDIQEYEVGGKYYSFIYDDEFLYSGKTYTTVTDKEGNPMIVGNVYVCGQADEEGADTSLTVEDIQNIMNHLVMVQFDNGKFGSMIQIDKSILEIQQDIEDMYAGLDMEVIHI